MGLLRKLRVLAGALVHKPFMPRQDKVNLDEGSGAPGETPARLDSPRSDAEEPDVTDGERVADLIARQQREQAN
jgi:hypothetical protein